MGNRIPLHLIITYIRIVFIDVSIFFLQSQNNKSGYNINNTYIFCSFSIIILDFKY